MGGGPLIMKSRERRGLGWLQPALELLRLRYFRRGRVRDDWSSTEWLKAIGAALAERLAPALGESAAAMEVELPKRCWAVLTAARLENERRTAVQERGLNELAPSLEANGIRPVLFKGLALARYYPAPAAREPGDIDLLVAPEQLAVVEEIVRAAGYRHAAGGGRLSARYAVTYVRGDSEKEEIQLDLHPAWHEVSVGSDGSVTVGKLRAVTAEAEIGAVRWRVLPADIELYLTSAHAVLHSFRTLSVYLDLAVQLDAAGESALESAGELARAMGRERHLRHSLTAAGELFDLQVDQHLTLPRRLGVPVSLRLGYLGSGVRFLPSSLMMELALRRGLRRKYDFARWVLGHGGGEPARGGSAAALRRLLRFVWGLRWFKGTMLRYRVPRSVPLRS